VVDIFRYHEISESTSRILNPLSETKLDELGRICRLQAGQRHLDLACGKGEMVCRYARAHQTSGVGVDIHPPFLDAARARARELQVDDRVTFTEGDAADPGDPGDHYDVVSCIGATWIGGGLAGTLDLMRRRARPRAWLLVGEVFWAEEPPPAVRGSQEAAQTFADLGGTLDRIEAAGLELVEMLLASSDDWDRYQACRWMAVSEWLATHSDDADADAIRAMSDGWRRSYLTDLRRCMGWGVFVLRDRQE
jgi:SAM-dependent methyltransferase